jgi:glycosyltransferase involved in cell wall biosynthesis
MLGIHRAVGTYDRAVDAYSAPSAFCAEHLGGHGVPRQKITVRPNFLGHDPGPRLASQNYALFVGRLCEEKGVRQLLKAWRQMPHIPLVIVGDGPLRSEAEVMATKNVDFTGALPVSQTMARMKSARFLVFPSVGYETFGMAVLEAAACGVTTIGSRVGAIPELIHEGRTGLLFDPQNINELIEKVEWAWAHPVTVNEMGAAARRQYLQHYAADKAYEDLTSFYASVSANWETESLSRGAVA